MSDTFFGSINTVGNVLISSLTSSGSSSAISFSSIPTTYNHLFLVVMGQQSSGNADCTMTVNGISTSTYDSVLLYQNSGGSLAIATQQGSTSWAVGPLPNSTSTPGLSIFQFPFYSNANWNKIMQLGQGFIQQSSSINRLTYGTFSNRSTSAITSITFTSGGGNFVANTIANLYGSY